MAKVVGLIGSISGKLGNVVYAVTNGIQTARVYQSTVSNPKSALQTMQRAKANLAGRISGFTPKTAIMGLGNNTRTRRSEFLRILLKNAIVLSTDNGYKAKIDNPDIVFSKGTVLPSVLFSSAQALQNVVTVTLSGFSISSMSADVYATMQTRLVAMIYDNATQDLVEIVTVVANKPEQGGNAQTTMITAHPQGYYCDIYAIPMSTGDGSKVNINTDLAKKDDSAIAAALSINGNAVVFDYGRSVLLANASFVPEP